MIALRAVAASFPDATRGGPHKIGRGLHHSNANAGLKRLFKFFFYCKSITYVCKFIDKDIVIANL